MRLRLVILLPLAHLGMGVASPIPNCPKALQPICAVLQALRSVVTKLTQPLKRLLQPVSLPYSKTSVSVAQPADDIEYWTLTDSKTGTAVTISTLGATITQLLAPDAKGVLDDLVLGFESADGYRTNEPYFGCIVGRVANRIADGKFSLGGETFTLAQNNGPNCLHGGVEGFHRKIWSATEVPGGVQLSMHSPDGDGGFPGALNVSATYTLDACLHGARLELEMVATVPVSAEEGGKVTPVNLAQHTYFNLGGHSAASSGSSFKEMPTVAQHEVTLSADAYTPLNRDLIPTGELAPVAGTAMDLTRSGEPLGPKLAKLAELAATETETATSDGLPARGPTGFDHNFALRPASSSAKAAAKGLHLAATVVDGGGSGRTLTVETTAPGVQFYTGNFLDGVAGKRGVTYGRHAGLCLETQHFPSSVDEDSAVTNAFDAVGGATPILVPGTGDEYRHVVAYTFGTTAASA